MVAELKGPTGGPYYCSNCYIRQPYARVHCIFCGQMFSNYETIIIAEDAELFLSHMKEKEKNISHLREGDNVQ